MRSAHVGAMGRFAKGSGWHSAGACLLLALAQPACGDSGSAKDDEESSAGSGTGGAGTGGTGTGGTGTGGNAGSAGD